MSRYVFDIETDGLLDVVSRIHSLVLLDTDTGDIISCCSQIGYNSIQHGLKLLAEADLIIGHNIICYDIPVIQKLYPEWTTKAKVRDTLTLSRLIWPEIKEQVDFRLLRKGKVESGKWIGRHRLGDWGIRLGFPKDDYAERMEKQGLDPWAAWNKEMQSYCEQDVRVTLKLWETILAKEYSETAVELEHRFQEIIFRQEQAGFPFDVASASKLYADLAARREELGDKLRGMFRPWYKPMKEFIPKADNRRFGYRAGCPMTKIKLVEFNPNSREHIAEVLQRHRKWQPVEFTDTGLPTVSETVLETLAQQWPECADMNEYLMVQKRIGQLAEGKNGWLKLERDGRIHGRVITNGAVTGRCTHMDPNVAQAPRPGTPYGKEFRSLFHAPNGWELLGCDASGLELRVLAHYMARYDGGKYAKVILEGDIHSVNASALFGMDVDQFLAGRKDESNLLENAKKHPGSGEYLRSLNPGARKKAKVHDYYDFRRNQTKTFIYAFLYGAGPVKIGSIVAPLAGENEQKKLGSQLMNRFLSKTPALKRLRQDVKAAYKARKGYLVGIDGRLLHVRKDHAALNTLFQNAGAVAVKQATVFLYDALHEAGFEWGRDWVQVAHIHDEYQLLIRQGLGDQIGPIAVQAIRDAGTFFKFRLPLDGEYKVGRNWAETH